MTLKSIEFCRKHVAFVWNSYIRKLLSYKFTFHISVRWISIKYFSVERVLVFFVLLKNGKAVMLRYASISHARYYCDWRTRQNDIPKKNLHVFYMFKVVEPYFCFARRWLRETLVDSILHRNICCRRCVSLTSRDVWMKIELFLYPEIWYATHSKCWSAGI